ncbi:MAG: hypothetical protein HQ567_18495, partial [Candidatus Nealsonbacteria bacterium]|nr:hypothetical protein [Candidatus Nealsonbacteria bacterium]
MRTVNRSVVLYLSLSIGVVPCLLRAGEAPTKKRGPLITVSKETTRITSPLREDGYVDYVAALNEMCSAGVTPENNAIVPLWRAMGPGDISEKIREDYFRQLGIPPLTEEGDYFVSFEDYLRGQGIEESEDTNRQWERSRQGPWSGKDCPAAAGWLKANEKPLRQIVEASRRTRYYSPLIATDDDVAPLVSVMLPACSEMRCAARALTARAMLYMGQGKTDRARQDLLACHRLGRLSGQGPTLIDALIGIAIDSVACQGDTAVVQSGELTANQAKKYRAELLRLAPSSRMVDKIDTGERFMFLDSVAGIAREGPMALQQLAGGGSGEPVIAEKLLKWATRRAIDWDEVLRMGNSYYDRMVEGGRKPTRAERNVASDELLAEVKKLAAALKDPKSIAMTLLSGKSPRQIATQQMGGLFIALLLPAVDAAIDAEYRGTMRMEVTQLAFALAGYRADHDGYPAKLQQLVPKYAETLPKDAFSDGPLQYKHSDTGYLLYSIGRNGEDEGGRNRHQDPEAEDDPD